MYSERESSTETLGCSPDVCVRNKELLQVKNDKSNVYKKIQNVKCFKA